METNLCTDNLCRGRLLEPFCKSVDIFRADIGICTMKTVDKDAVEAQDGVRLTEIKFAIWLGISFAIGVD